jgi:hypothetical protein
MTKKAGNQNRLREVAADCATSLSLYLLWAGRSRC